MFFDLDTNQAGLVVPGVSDHEVLFSGEVDVAAEASRAIGAAVEVMDYSQFVEYLLSNPTNGATHTCTLYTLGAKSKITLPGEFLEKIKAVNPERINLVDSILGPVLSEMRVIKDLDEIALMKFASDISSEAYREVVCRGHWGENDAKGRAKYEWQISEQFQLYCRMKGADFLMPYKPIVAHHQNAAILHYHPKHVALKKGNLILLDMGCQVGGYASDISRTYPLGQNARFTQNQRVIYSIVLNSQKAAIGAVKENSSFLEISEAVNKTIIEGLLEAEVLKGGDVETLFKLNIHRSFMPHSLGHYLGLHVHDCHLPDPLKPSGRPISQESNLQRGMVFTIEPGVYFIESLLKELAEKHPNHLNTQKLASFMDVGGVRIEDNIAIDPRTGQIINLTTAPKEIDEIEALLARP